MHPSTPKIGLVLLMRILVLKIGLILSKSQGLHACTPNAASPCIEH